MKHISLIRSTSFLAVLVFMNILQILIPSRPFEKARWKDMISNLTLVAFNNLLLSFIPLIPYTAAVFVVNNQIGLLSFFPIARSLTITIGVLLLDIVIYFQHRLFHVSNYLWKLHAMHHTDSMLDATSGLRFHPIEIILSNFIKVGTIFIFGITPLTVVIFEITLNLLAMFNHSNIVLKPRFENIINKILITPALHTIHHSKIREETNSNYGFSVPWWDKLFGTFTSKGKYPQERIKIGTIPMPEKKHRLFPGVLLQPFAKKNRCN